MTPRKTKSLFRWSSEAPCREGYWWFRHSDQHDEQMVKVFLDGTGEWSLLYRDLEADPEDMDASVCWVANFAQEGAQWAGPIPEPRE